MVRRDARAALDASQRAFLEGSDDRPKAVPKPAAPDAGSFPATVSTTIRWSPDLAARLRTLSAARKNRRETPATVNDIVTEAVVRYLDDVGA